MLADERRTQILKKLNENRYVQVSDLADEFDVTTVTIRRDLDEMEADGLCIRKRGGAIRVNPGVSMEMPYNIKRHEMVDEKDRIAQEALRYVKDGDTFILDAGSTTYALAMLLNTKARVTVVTNDLKIATKLSENPNINTICTGGVARTSVYSLQGTLTESFIKDIKVDKTFLGADAINQDGVISNVNIEEVAIKKAMIKAADQTILLADSSKFTKSGFYRVCDLEDIDILITDSGISEKSLELVESYNIKRFIV
ncbi:MAG: DeoR/GlpR family DNA-binding transcription regulator [Chloroflexota bacterium]|jgi:DeoR family fructose operon transcriptional repressor|nr:DeoR/GlpR family DNA-binding transcription regulator [Chloroflexota bacterium]